MKMSMNAASKKIYFVIPIMFKSLLVSIDSSYNSVSILLCRPMKEKEKKMFYKWSFPEDVYSGSYSYIISDIESKKIEPSKTSRMR